MLTVDQPQSAGTSPATPPYRSRFLKIDPSRKRFQVHRSAFADAAVFEEEKRKILLKSWLFLGHDSEIRNPNDFLLRRILDKSVIFTRGRDGEVRAFLNTCPHRGAALCREKTGNRKSFACAYHGWTFRNTGELFDQSAGEGYPADFNDEGDYNLFPVPRLAARSGFWFLNFDKDAAGLDESLAGAGLNIDLFAAQSAAGIEVIRGCHEYRIKANYKLLCENSMDGYHLSTTHASYIEFITAQHKGQARGARGDAEALGNGHGCLTMDVGAGRPVAQWLPIWGEQARIEIEAKMAELTARLGPERADRVGNFNCMMTVFPNTVVADQHAIQVRSILPLSHDEMLVRAWVLGPVDESPLLRKLRVQNAQSFLGPAGFGTPDDAEMLEQAQAGYAMGGIEWNDISKGFEAGEDAEHGHGAWSGELQMRSYWLQYDRMMRAEG